MPTAMMALARMTWRVGLLVAVMTVMWVAGLRLRPHTPPAGFDLLLPDMLCDPPCVLGVQPGVSTVGEVVSQLRTHFDERSFEVKQDLILNYNIIVRPDEMPAIERIYIHADRQAVVTLIAVESALPLAAYRLVHPTPDESVIIGDCHKGSIVERYGNHMEVSYSSEENPTYRAILQRPFDIRIVARASDAVIYRAKGAYSNMVFPFATPNIAHRSC